MRIKITATVMLETLTLLAAIALLLITLSSPAKASNFGDDGQQYEAIISFQRTDTSYTEFTTLGPFNSRSDCERAAQIEVYRYQADRTTYLGADYVCKSY